MRSVDDAIQDRVPQSWIPDNLVPATDGNLAGDQQRPFPFPVVDDLQQVAALLGVQWLRSPVGDDEGGGPPRSSQRARHPPLAGWGGGVGERGGPPPIEHGEPITAGFM